MIRNPEGFYTYKNRLDEYRVFRSETMRTLRRSELSVWLAIHGCQHKNAAQISLNRIGTVAGVKGKQHVLAAIKSLRERGLLEILYQGCFRPNGAEGSGLASVYRVYPRPEPRLLKLVPASQNGPSGVGAVAGCVGDPKQSDITKPTKPTKPR